MSQCDLQLSARPVVPRQKLALSSATSSTCTVGYGADMEVVTLVQFCRTQWLPSFWEVVTGMNYYLDLEMGRITCTKTQSDLSKCAFDDSQDEQRTFCSFQVYSVPWLGQISVTEYSCHNE
ncbi:cystatin-C-like [Marmota monax]|uniref:cystatin-C-like n=1 Tax=Marmota monax TaxID=9995 RepID=UPI001EB04452|nr:cystatin-C-like [Marmota monax]